MNLNDIKKLNQKKYREKFQYALIEGPHAISELVQSDFTECEIFGLSKYEKFQSKFKFNDLENFQIDKISDSINSQGIFVIVPLNNFTKLEPLPNYIFLDQIQDPGNLGTIIRTAAWFGDYTVALSKNSCDPFNPKVIRATAGGIFKIPILIDQELDELHVPENHIFAFDMSGKDINHVSIPDKHCLVFGNEGNGLSKEILEKEHFQKISIKGSGSIESMNVAVCASIALFKFSKT